MELDTKLKQIPESTLRIIKFYLTNNLFEIKSRNPEELNKINYRAIKTCIPENYNYLIPDNYQEDRKEKLVDRTSSTNIGLEIASIISRKRNIIR